MKKIFWTTVFWLAVFFGFIIYVKLFDAHMASGIGTWFAGSSTSGAVVATVTPGTQNDVISGIVSIQTTLTDMQTKLNTLVGATSAGTSVTIAAPAPTPVPPTVTASPETTGVVPTVAK